MKTVEDFVNAVVEVKRTGEGVGQVVIAVDAADMDCSSNIKKAALRAAERAGMNEAGYSRMIGPRAYSLIGRSKRGALSMEDLLDTITAPADTDPTVCVVTVNFREPGSPIA